MNRRRYGGPAPLVLTGFEGTSVPASLADALRDGHLAGVFLRRGNCESVSQVRALCAEIRSFAGGGLPLIIAIDEEGGLVSHLAHILPAPPAPMAIAAAGARAREIGRHAGSMLRRLGINTVFAPVADVNTEPTNPVIGSRSFGDEPDPVARLAAEMVQGYRDVGLLATVKHFPGHGMTAADSHTVLPVVDLDEVKMVAHLKPFRAATRAGADLVMTAHVAYPALEADIVARTNDVPSDGLRPATLSSILLRRLLREEIAFAGPVVSDAFEMAGLAGVGSAQEVVERGVVAGVDLWLLAFGLESLDAVDRGIARVARDGGGRFLVQQSGARVNALRTRIAAAAPIDGEAVDEATARLFEDVAEGAVCVLRGAEGFPMKAKRPLFLMPAGWAPHLVIDRAGTEGLIRERWAGAIVVWMDGDADPGLLAAHSDDVDTIVAATVSRGPMRPSMRALLEEADASAKPLTAVAFLDPYDVAAFPARAAAIATLGARPENLRALVAFVATGKGGKGRLPVRV